MVWTASNYAVSEEALIDNTLVLVTRDFKPALDVLYPAQASLTEGHADYLADFKERTLGMVLGNEAPNLAISPSRNASTLSDDAAYLKEALRMDLTVGVMDDGPDTVTRRIMRYMRTLEAVLRNGQKNDFFGVANNARTLGFALDCEHVYKPDIFSDQSIYVRVATLQVTVNINEGQ